MAKYKRTHNHWARIVMDDNIEEMLDALGIELTRCKALEIGDDLWEKQLFKECKSVFFPEFDICRDSLDETFDLIIAEQVFEHLRYPCRAVKNVLAMLEPGGHFLISTPFLIRVHPEPDDCTRWTETGLTYFLHECGFALEKIHTRSWGNKACAEANFTSWTQYDEKVHSLTNEPDFPIVIWAFAQKQDA